MLPRAYKPAGLTFDETSRDGVYEAAIRPRRWTAIPMVFFCVVWDGFMAVWYTLAIWQRIWPMTAFGVFHLGAGVFLTHKTLVALFNTPRFTMGAGRFRYVNGPIPFAGSFDVPLDGIDSFTVSESTGGRSATRSLSANLREGTARKFPIGTDDFEAMQYVAQSLNQGLAGARRPNATESAYRD